MSQLAALVTAYCLCSECCGTSSPDSGGLGLTASGRKPVTGVTIAAPRSVPFGTRVLVTIPGLMHRKVFRVDDRTHRSHDGTWDIFMAGHRDAVRFGRRRGKIERDVQRTR